MDTYIKKYLSTFILQKEIVTDAALETLPQYIQTSEPFLTYKTFEHFNEDRYRQGFKSAFWVLMRYPLQKPKFYKDILYHIKRKIKQGI